MRRQWLLDGLKTSGWAKGYLQVSVVLTLTRYEIVSCKADCDLVDGVTE